MVNEVEKKAYKMLPGEIKGVNTKNGHFILFVEEITPRKRSEFKYEKIRIQQDLTNAKAISNIESINKLFYNGKIEVKEDNIPAINFSFSILNRNANKDVLVSSKNKEPIIAKAWGNNITSKKFLRSIIRGLRTISF